MSDELNWYTEAQQRIARAPDVVRRGVEPQIQIFRRPRAGVQRHRVAPDHQVTHSGACERRKHLDQIGGQGHRGVASSTLSAKARSRPRSVPPARPGPRMPGRPRRARHGCSRVRPPSRACSPSSPWILSSTGERFPSLSRRSRRFGRGRRARSREAASTRRGWASISGFGRSGNQARGGGDIPGGPIGPGGRGPGAGGVFRPSASKAR